MQDADITKDAQALLDLEKRLDPATSPLSDLIDLAVLYIYPFHKEDRAIEILERVLARDPGNPWGTYWLAYCHFRQYGDLESERKAKQIVESWISSHPCDAENAAECAAMYQLLMEIRDDLIPQELSDTERIALLEKSVRYAPKWSRNRLMLARAYMEVGRLAEAVRQVEAAKENMIEPDPAWGPHKENFEIIVAGRTHPYIAQEIEELLPKLRKRLERKR